MRFEYCAFTAAKILNFLMVLILLPILTAVYYKEYNAVLPFVYTALAALIINLIFRKAAMGVENLNDIRKTDGFGIVIITWFIAALICSIPFLFFGFSPEDAFFEGTSGITTTGGSILTHYNYPHALIFWRSFMQWMGGLGILVLFIAVLPQFAVAGRQMFFTDTPNAKDEKLTPRIRLTAASMYKIYLGLTVLQVILLKFAGMPWFEGICASLSTVACGGFVVRENIIAESSNIIIWIILVFMAISGTSFVLMSKVIKKFNPLLLFKNEEFRVYLYVFFSLAVILAVVGYLGIAHNETHIIRDSMFTVVSVMTSTGFSSGDCWNWGLAAQAFLIIAMFTGASAGSASGSIKIIRWVYIFNLLKTEVTRIFHPNAVINVKFNNSIVPKEVLGQVLIFMFFYFLMAAFTALIISILENDAFKGIIGAINTIGNIGFAPREGFASFCPLSKVILSFNMLIGRLEIIPFLVVFQPEFWRR